MSVVSDQQEARAAEEREQGTEAGRGTEATALRQADRAFACLLEATRHLNGAQDLDAALQHVLSELRQWIPYDNAAILLLGERGRHLRIVASEGYSEAVAQHWRFGLGQGLVGTVAKSGETILCHEVRSDSRYLDATTGTRSEIAVPLRAQDRVIGVLDLGKQEVDYFDDSHRRWLELLATTLASAVDSVRLRQNIREQTRSLALLHEVSRELTSILDRRRVIERVAERLRCLVDYDVLTIYLWNETADALEPWLAVQKEGTIELFQRKLLLGEGITGTAAALRQPIRIPNTDLDPRHIRCELYPPMRSELAAPLVFEDRLVGAVDIESTRYDNFTVQHELLLATLASALAIALVNAEAVERSEARERELDRDLKMARKVQRQLLPASTPWAPGLEIAAAYDTAKHLGGDFHDFLRYPDGRIAVAVGDVAGKSTSAALYGALSIGALREIASQSRPSPGELLAGLNSRLRELEIRDRFLALLVAVFDPEDRSVVLANSGLPYPSFLRDGKVESIEVAGLPLGLFPEPRYQEQQLTLEPEDTLILASDGLDEERNVFDEEFGKERLRRALEKLARGSAAEIAEGLLDTVRSFAGTTEPTDDRTVVVLKAR